MAWRSYGTVAEEEGGRRAGGRKTASLVAALAFTAVAAVLCIIALTQSQDKKSELVDEKLVLFKMEPPPEPWSPPANLWMFWGQSPNKRFGHSGDNIRHLVKLGRLAGGEYRDPHFLFNFDSQTFRDLSESCCTTMLVAPMKNDMPIYNAESNVAQRLRTPLADGDILLMIKQETMWPMETTLSSRVDLWCRLNSSTDTSSTTSSRNHPLERLRAQIDEAYELSGYGNWSPGPFRKLITKDLPWVYKLTPDTLYQDHTSVQSMALRSLPSGTSVIYMTPKSSPVFLIKFCQRLSERHGEPPIKTVPKDCWRHAASGYPCSCGTISYIGYDWHYDQDAADWDKVMLAAVEYQSDPDESTTFSPNCKQPPRIMNVVLVSRQSLDPHI
eukprot:768590-Hanusia_phi.AAC.27